jgi:hypothetical protein
MPLFKTISKMLSMICENLHDRRLNGSTCVLHLVVVFLTCLQ